MGDRATVVFKSGDEFSPGVYTHWSGDAIPDYLKQAGPSLREGDPGYASARFCGFLCSKNPNSLTGVGLLDKPSPNDVADEFKSYSPGDNGVFVVDVENGQVKNFGGYTNIKDFEIVLGKG